jgi:hypothetical protein
MILRLESERRRIMLRPWSALLLSLLGPAAWLLGLGDPAIRSTGWPIYAAAAVAVPLALSGLRRRRLAVWIPVFLTLLISLGAVGFLRFGTKTPASPEAWERIVELPELTLPDQEGRARELRALAAAGPTLWVFFRGHW